eukprot:Nk52_evm10s262 gene=Nk52_evmTU10s262
MNNTYGNVDDMNVCDNLGEHLLGNVYVKFDNEEDAEKAVVELNNRFYNGEPIYAELCPVTDFREACCRQYEQSSCNRGGFCNFMHLKPIGRELKYELFGSRKRGSSPSRDRDRDRRRRSRSRSPPRRRRRDDRYEERGSRYDDYDRRERSDRSDRGRDRERSDRDRERDRDREYRRERRDDSRREDSRREDKGDTSDIRGREEL